MFYLFVWGESKSNLFLCVYARVCTPMCMGFGTARTPKATAYDIIFKDPALSPRKICNPYLGVVYTKS